MPCLSLSTILVLCTITIPCIIQILAAFHKSIGIPNVANSNYTFNSTILQSAGIATTAEFTTNYSEKEIELSSPTFATPNASESLNSTNTHHLQRHWAFYIEVSNKNAINVHYKPE